MNVTTVPTVTDATARMMVLRYMRSNGTVLRVLM